MAEDILQPVQPNLRIVSKYLYTAAESRRRRGARRRGLGYTGTRAGGHDHT
jgi:hypothetical protein